MNSNTPPAPALSTYEQNALDFLAKHGIAFRATLTKVQKAPAWAKDGEAHGLHYWITLSRKVRPGGVNPVHVSPLSFDFWDSVSAKEKGETLSAYDVLAGISGDVHCPETFADFCWDYGYEEDSRAAHATFKRCAAFGKRLRAFFTDAEIEGLSEIQ
jgi:hypothetical protein